jgi:hypothetical protein
METDTLEEQLWRKQKTGIQKITSEIWDYRNTKINRRKEETIGVMKYTVRQTI